MSGKLPEPAFEIPPAHRFSAQRMVNWLSPGQLLDTGLKALLSGLFGAYADKREVQAALVQALAPDHDYSEGGEIWFDYVADLGDGFNPTYATAWLMARPGLSVPGAPEELPRGRFLILGGDQVYPTASAQEYQDRLVGPFGAVLPRVETGWPHVYAIPGNHDWYDGLTSFLRIFCQTRSPGSTGSVLPRSRWLGAWETRQRRSYFALKLPANWWLWGTDIQLSADIDKPQLEYFFDVIAPQMQEEARRTGCEPRVILVTASPSWVFCVDRPAPGGHSVDDPKSFESLAYFEKLIRRSGARLALVLSGDLHHYCRYEQQTSDPGEPKTHRITSGGGGAYLFATHQMPDRIKVPEESAKDVVKQTVYRREAIFPSESESRQEARGVWGLPWRNVSFSALLGSLYILFAWTLQSASHSINGMSKSLADSLLDARGPGEVVHQFAQVFAHSPASVLFLLIVLGGAFAFAWTEGKPYRPRLPVLGLVHGVGHLLICLGLIDLLSYVNLGWLHLKPEAISLVLVFIAETLLLGGLLGSLWFAAYLLAASKLCCGHTNEVFSSQSIQDYKNFLRLRITPDGELTIHPLGVRKVPHSWELNPRATSAGGTESWWNPPEKALEPCLIEEPVTIR